VPAACVQAGQDRIGPGIEQCRATPIVTGGRAVQRPTIPGSSDRHGPPGRQRSWVVRRGMRALRASARARSSRRTARRPGPERERRLMEVCLDAPPPQPRDGEGAAGCGRRSSDVDNAPLLTRPTARKSAPVCTNGTLAH
jgi:hypothetical protein